jgi:membrane protease YdiL (CAAX protease family)
MHKMTEIKEPARVITGAIGSALLIVATGSVPWFVLMHINIRHARSIPWAGLLMLAYLWFFWRYLGGRIGPLASRSWRRANLQANSIVPSLWLWALIAGGLAMVSIGEMEQISGRLPRHPSEGLAGGIGSFAQYPFVLALSFLLVTNTVAAFVEEAAFRGYMQYRLVHRFGKVRTFLIVGFVFSVFHLPGRDPATWAFGVPAWILISVVFSALVALTGSIWPAVICHAGINLVEDGVGWWVGSSASIWTTGLDGWFWLECTVFVAFGIAAVVAFRKLAASSRMAQIEGERLQ